jgi:hypothetical protein
MTLGNGAETEVPVTNIISNAQNEYLYGLRDMSFPLWRDTAVGTTTYGDAGRTNYPTVRPNVISKCMLSDR